MQTKRFTRLFFKILSTSIFTVFFLSCAENKEATTVVVTKNDVAMDIPTDTTDEIPVYDFATLQPELYSKTSSIKIVNFWAMWCVPCIKELPYLEEYAATHPEVELTLISLDFPEDIDTKLKPFLKKKNIQSKVILLDAPDANSWIDKVSPSWSGAIPFTILSTNEISTNEKRSYLERTFESVEDVSIEINKLQL